MYEKIKVQRVADYARSKEFIIYRNTETGNWFYGAEDDYWEAYRIAVEVDGDVIATDLVE